MAIFSKLSTHMHTYKLLYINGSDALGSIMLSAGSSSSAEAVLLVHVRLSSICISSSICPYASPPTPQYAKRFYLFAFLPGILKDLSAIFTLSVYCYSFHCTHYAAHTRATMASANMSVRNCIHNFSIKRVL